MRYFLLLTLIVMISGISGCDDAKQREMEMQVAILKDRNEQLTLENEKLKGGLESSKEQIDSLQDEVEELKDKQSKLDKAIANGTEKLGNLADLKELLPGLLENKELLPGLLENAASAINAGKELDLPEFEGIDPKKIIKEALEKRKKAKEAKEKESDEAPNDK